MSLREGLVSLGMVVGVVRDGEFHVATTTVTLDGMVGMKGRAA